LHIRGTTFAFKYKVKTVIEKMKSVICLCCLAIIFEKIQLIIKTYRFEFVFLLRFSQLSDLLVLVTMEKLTLTVSPSFSQITKLFFVVMASIRLHGSPFPILSACFL
jgi:hypothetical protein